MRQHLLLRGSRDFDSEAEYDRILEGVLERANALRATRVAEELSKLAIAGQQICRAGMALHAGHGLTVGNLEPVARITGLKEVNIGHDIIARAIFIGLDAAVKELLAVLRHSAVR